MGEEKKYMRRLDFNGELKYIKDEEARADLISEIQIDGEPVEKADNTVNLVGFATTSYVDEKVASATHFKGGFAATGDGPIDNSEETLKLSAWLDSNCPYALGDTRSVVYMLNRGW